MDHAHIRSDLIGRLDPIETPFGCKPLVYADWTASGRPLASIESFMRHVVLPVYGNTHTTSSETGAQTSAFREEARQIIAKAVNAKVSGEGDGDVVLFVGSGTTAAVAKIASVLSLGRKSRSWRITKDSTPVVFVGPFEHHSNILPWRESRADVVQIAENASGGLDVDDLERQLKKFSRRKLKIGSFAAASNVTGALEDTDTITRLLHRGGALSFWDYATAAPYVHVNMNPDGLNASDKAAVAKDAVFISGHKFLGGAGTPGLLVCKRRLFKNKTPVVPGGGTVLFVTHADHTYLSNIEEREEGGTPDILGSIRLGLVFQTKERIGSVERREEELAQLGLATLRLNSNIFLLGDTGRKRLPIFSFLVRHGECYLHHNFVCTLLNDLFGVQARAGCQCAGPYGMRLLGITDTSAPKIKKQLQENNIGIIKPGACRFSLTFFMSDAEVKYILDAVTFVADHGPSFLPLYQPDVESAEWVFRALPDSAPYRVTRKRLSEARCGFSENLSGAPPTKETVTVEGKYRDTSIGALSVESEAGMLKRHVDDALRLALTVESMDPFSAPKEVKNARSRSTKEIHLPRKIGQLAARRSGKISTSRETTGTRKALNKEVEAIRWFFLPFEDPSHQASSRIGRSKATRSIIMPKVYLHGKQPHGKHWGRDSRSDCT